MGVDRWNGKLQTFCSIYSLDGDELSDIILSAFLNEQKKQLLSQATHSGCPKRRATARRFSRRCRRKFLKRLERRSGFKRRVLTDIDALLYTPRPDRLRDALVPSFLENWRPIRQRVKHQTKVTSLRDFSLAKDPVKTMKALRSLTEACSLYRDIKLNFRDTDCDDVTPYIVLAHLRRSLPPIISGGEITHEVSEVINAVGMRRSLRMGTISSTRGNTHSVSAFKLVDRAPPGAFGDKDHLLRPQFKEIVADKFCDTINGCLREHDLELTEEAESSFVRAIGEALDNAERHGDPQRHGTEGDWSIAAFSRLMHDAETPLLRCSIGIVSIGATISDSLASAANPVTKRIDEYVKRHTPLFRTNHSVEGLRTVMALQDGITRVERATSGRRGGVGFMELIEVISELGETERSELQSAFTVISGKTCIRITHPFRRGEPNENGLRELWFNEENNDSSPPSGDHVLTLDDHFPGVILSACFTIDPDYLRKKIAV